MCLTLLALVIATVLCAERLALPDQVFTSARVVELTLTYGKPPRTEARVLFPSGSAEPVPKLEAALGPRSPCQPLARKRKQLKWIAFLDAHGRPLAGLEHDPGEGTDLDPAYPALVEAVLEAKGWRDERMRAVGAEQLWQAPRRALASENPYLRRLAASFLVSHGASDVVDAVWGAPGSELRANRELPPLSAPICPRRK